MSYATEQSLLNPTDDSGNAILSGSQLTAWQATITQLYNDSLSASLGANGLILSGPGHFKINAGTIDLGVSSGIVVNAPDTALANISPDGADIFIKTAGNLDMTTTTIANESYLGAITLNVGGQLDVGGQLSAFGTPGEALGIFTTGGGTISVTANNDVDVDGSRIAAYDGGDVDVKSLGGDVNAGTGGAGYVAFTALEFDPSSGDLNPIPAQIPGSGILDTTVPGGQALLGNITVNAPNGDINASLGGIIQIAFNGEDDQDNFISLTAGGDINANGSGIIGSNIRLEAGGNVTGVVIGSQSVNINAVQNVDVTAVSGGNVDIASSGQVTGTIVSGGNLDVSGSSIDASLVSESVSASGDTSGSSVGVPQSNVSQVSTQSADDAAEAASKTDAGDDDDEKKKRSQVSLAQKTSRVTVILPKSNSSNP
jgi:filamentous hemagglutinin